MSMKERKEVLGWSGEVGICKSLGEGASILYKGDERAWKVCQLLITDDIALVADLSERL